MNYYGNDIDNYRNGGFTNYYSGDGARRDFRIGGRRTRSMAAKAMISWEAAPAGSLLGSNTPTDPYYYSFGPSGNDLLEGGSGDDAVYGADGDDTIYGGDGNDGGTIVGYFGLLWRGGLYGGEGNDRIDGGAGNDVIDGGIGADYLTGGGDADVFMFNRIADSVAGSAQDLIWDFARTDGDLIDLSAIDAKANKIGDQPFKFIGGKPFHDKAGELRYSKNKVSGDVNGDGRADFQIKVVGLDKMFKADF